MSSEISELRESTVRTADGADLAVLQAGEAGRPVVLAVHGFASTAQANWVATGWVRALTEAGLGFLAFDLRGHGGSRAATPVGLTQLASDGLAVLDAVGVERAHWLGYSLGARLGLEAAQVEPDRLLSLVLGGIPGNDPTPERLTTLATEAGLLTDTLEAFARGLGPGGGVPPAPPAGLPTLVVVGDADDVAADAVSWAEARELPIRTLPGRTHANAVSARAFKEAAIEVMTSVSGPD